MFFAAGSTAEPDAEQDQEGRVVPGPLVLGLLPVVEVAVDALRRREEVEHLPQGELKVHLPHVEQPPQVLVALGAGRVAGRVPGARRAVAVRRGGRQHGAGGGQVVRVMGEFQRYLLLNPLKPNSSHSIPAAACVLTSKVQKVNNAAVLLQQPTFFES